MAIIGSGSRKSTTKVTITTPNKQPTNPYPKKGSKIRALNHESISKTRKLTILEKLIGKIEGRGNCIWVMNLRTNGWLLCLGRTRVGSRTWEPVWWLIIDDSRSGNEWRRRWWIRWWGACWMSGCFGLWEWLVCSPKAHKMRTSPILKASLPHTVSLLTIHPKLTRDSHTQHKPTT